MLAAVVQVAQHAFRNGIELKHMLLEDWHPPERNALIESLGKTAEAPRKRAA
jgi:hypothetical protein